MAGGFLVSVGHAEVQRRGAYAGAAQSLIYLDELWKSKRFSGFARLRPAPPSLSVYNMHKVSMLLRFGILRSGRSGLNFKQN